MPDNSDFFLITPFKQLTVKSPVDSLKQEFCSYRNTKIRFNYHPTSNQIRIALILIDFNIAVTLYLTQLVIQLTVYLTAKNIFFVVMTLFLKLNVKFRNDLIMIKSYLITLKIAKLL